MNVELRTPPVPPPRGVVTGSRRQREPEQIPGGHRPAPGASLRCPPGFAALTAAAIVTTAVMAVFLVRYTGTPGAKILNDGGQLAAAVIAAAACLRASRRQPERRRAWRLLGVGALVWAAGAASWMTYGLARRGEYPFPSVADLGFVGYVIPAVAGLLAFPLGRSRAVHRIRTFCDALVIGACVLFVS